MEYTVCIMMVMVVIKAMIMIIVAVKMNAELKVLIMNKGCDGYYCNAASLLFVFINSYFIQFHYHFIILIVLLFCCLSNILL